MMGQKVDAMTSGARVDPLGISTMPVSAILFGSDGNRITSISSGTAVGLSVDLITSSPTVVDVPIQRMQALRGSYFSTTSDFVTFGGSNETPLFLFVNLSTNTKNAYLDNLHASFAANNTGNGIAIFRVYRNSVITSSGTPVGIFPGDVNSGATSQMQAFVTPVASSFGTPVFTISSSGGSFFQSLGQSRIFRPGTKFLVTIDNPANNFSDAFDIEWSEE